MADINRKYYARLDIEIVVDNVEVLWMNEKHTEEGLDHHNLREITTKYHSNH